MDNSDNLTCAFCGESKPDTRLRFDPYPHDIDGDNTEYSICDSCYEQRAEDI